MSLALTLVCVCWSTFYCSNMLTCVFIFLSLECVSCTSIFKLYHNIRNAVTMFLVASLGSYYKKMGKCYLNEQGQHNVSSSFVEIVFILYITYLHGAVENKIISFLYRLKRNCIIPDMKLLATLQLMLQSLFPKSLVTTKLLIFITSSINSGKVSG